MLLGVRPGISPNNVAQMVGCPITSPLAAVSDVHDRLIDRISTSFALAPNYANKVGKASRPVTRGRGARSLLVDGPATAAELAQRLNITAAGVRKHLDAPEETGDVLAGGSPAFGPPARGPRRGRPARIYSLTERGRARFEQSYDDLAVSAMRFLRRQVQPSALEEFARRRATELEQRYEPHLTGLADPQQRAHRLAELLSADGYAASVEEA